MTREQAVALGLHRCKSTGKDALRSAMTILRSLLVGVAVLSSPA
jgi:hypothetical protein